MYTDRSRIKHRINLKLYASVSEQVTERRENIEIATAEPARQSTGSEERVRQSRGAQHQGATASILIRRSWFGLRGPLQTSAARCHQPILEWWDWVDRCHNMGIAVDLLL